MPIFPFRHIEYRCLSLSSVAGVLSIVTIVQAQITISGVYLAATCCAIAAVATVIVWRALRRHYMPVMPQIIQGPKRIRSLALSIGFCLAAVLSSAALVANRHVPRGDIRYVDAKVLNVGQLVGPKLWGWDADFQFDGNSHYQIISASDAATAKRASVVRLGLQKGLFGYEFIVSVNARP